MIRLPVISSERARDLTSVVKTALPVCPPISRVSPETTYGSVASVLGERGNADDHSRMISRLQTAERVSKA